MRFVRSVLGAKASRHGDRVRRFSRLTSALSALSVFALATGTFIAGALFVASPASADSTATITVNATTFSVGTASNLGIALSGFSEAETTQSFQVTLKFVDSSGVTQSNGTLTASSTSGTNLIAGYSSYSASKLGFKGTYEAISSALQSITWTPSSSTDGLNLRIGLATAPGTNQYYDANSGHFYEYVGPGATGSEAKALAAAKTFLGLNGYLAHITTKAENDFIGSETNASNIYMGATDAVVEGQWRWSGADIAGESDFVFGTYSGSSTPTNTASGWGLGSWYSGRYVAWSNGQPNNSGGQDCAVTNWSGNMGSWNDWTCSDSTFGYLVEYGGAGGTYTGLALTSDTTLSASDARATWSSPSTPTTATTLSFGLSFTKAISGLTASDITNVGTATGCVFSPSASSAAVGTSVTITVTQCSTGTVQPRLANNSVVVAGGIVIPESTASAVAVNAGPITLQQSTFSLSGTLVSIGGSSVTLQVTPRDSFSRLSGTGRSVSVSAPPLTTRVVDNGNGSYTATLSPNTASGTANITVNVDGTTVSTGLSVSVWKSPVMQDNTVLGVTLRGEPYIDGVSATAYPDPTYSIASGSLPPGLRINSLTGAITGTPTLPGAYSFAVAINATGWYRLTTSTYTINVEQAPAVTGGVLTSVALTGTAYSDSVKIDAFPAPTYAVTEGAMPSGLTLDAATGAITGTAVRTGEYSFSVTATNIRGKVVVPLKLSVHRVPTAPSVTVPNSVSVGDPISGTATSSGYPDPTFSVASGSLPPGVSLNARSGSISGSPTSPGSFTFTIGATNTDGRAASPPSTITVEAVSDPVTDVAIAVPIGEKAFGAPVEIRSQGLAPSVDFAVTVRSTPQVVDNGRTTADGVATSDFTIPSNLEPGWHSITLTSTAPDGSPVEEKLWFEITETGILETVSKTEPSAAEKANAVNDDAAFFEAAGIDPAADVPPAEVASTVQSVATVVASVALVSAAAAAAAAGAAGSAGAASGGGTSGARTSAGGGTNSSSGGSGGSSGGGKDGGDGGDDSADYGSMEADHDDFADSGLAWGDRLAWWSSPFMRALDRITFALTESTSKLSPVLSRIINDGSYLRSMLGGLMIFVYIASAVLGAVSVDPAADNIASAGNIAALSVILVLGTLDAFAGLIGIAAFTVVSVSMFGITTVGDIRYLVAMFIAGFAPIILATTFRKIRRPKIDSFTTLLDRIIDVFMIAFVASLATLSVVGGISAFAGATVPLADAAKGLVFVITGVALIRIFLEELAARYFTERLDAINPTEVPGPGLVQQWVSLLFKYAVLVLMIGDMVGWGWWLWTGAFILFFPGVLGLLLPNLPKSRILTQLIPGGLAALLMATLLTGWSGDAVSAWYANTDLYGPMSFLLVPLPVIAVAIVGMFAAGGDKWYMTRYLKWIYYVGGIVVFSATVWVTDFFGQVFGQ